MYTKKNVNRSSCEVSIVICTYNRFKLLQDALASFAEQDGIDAIAYEVIVVDNASSDGTNTIVDYFLDGLTIRYIAEPELGLSNARNRGIKESKGEFIAFVDDDVLFSKQWLLQLVAGIHKWPKAAVFGGKAVAKWEVPKPKWFLESGSYDMRGMIAHFEPAQDEGLLGSKLLPYGCNMIIRSDMFAKYGNFHPELGRKGKSLIGSEEVCFFIRLRAGGEMIVYLPAALVYHRIVGNRSEKAYFIRWMRDAGKKAEIINNSNSYLGWGLMIYGGKRFIIEFVSWVLALISLRWHDLFGCRLYMIRSWSLIASQFFYKFHKR